MKVVDEQYITLKQAVADFLAREQLRQRTQQRLVQNECEIRWLNTELKTKKLSSANRVEYLHQIRHKEIEMAFLNQDYYGSI